MKGWAILVASIFMGGCAGSTQCALAQHSVSVLDMAIASALDDRKLSAETIIKLELEWQIAAMRMHSVCGKPG